MAAHVCTLLEVLCCCLELAARPAGPSHTAGPAEAAWRGLPNDAEAASSTLLCFVEAALVLVIAAQRAWLAASVPEAHMRQLEGALLSLARSTTSEVVNSWVPSQTYRELQTCCSTALQQLEPQMPSGQRQQVRAACAIAAACRHAENQQAVCLPWNISCCEEWATCFLLNAEPCHDRCRYRQAADLCGTARPSPPAGCHRAPACTMLHSAPAAGCQQRHPWAAHSSAPLATGCLRKACIRW